MKTQADTKTAAPDGTADDEINTNRLMLETEPQKIKRLLNATLKVTQAKADSNTRFEFDSLNRLSFKQAGKILSPILQKLGITGRMYYNQPLEVSFEYTVNGLRRSVAHQYKETNGDYRGFAAVQDNLEALSRNAYPMEMHPDEKPKTSDNHVTSVATLASILQTEQGYIPVKMTIKFYDDQGPKLHVIINGATPVQEVWTQKTPRTTEDDPAYVSISEFLRLVNSNEEFTKRIPRQVLVGKAKSETVYVCAIVIKDDKTQRYKIHEVPAINGSGAPLFKSESD